MKSSFLCYWMNDFPSFFIFFLLFSLDTRVLFLTFHSILHRSSSTWDRFRLFHFELSAAFSSLPSILFSSAHRFLYSQQTCFYDLLIIVYQSFSYIFTTFVSRKFSFFLRSFVDFFLCFNLFFWHLHNNSLFSFFQESGQSGLIYGIFRSLGTFSKHRFSIESNTSFPPNILIKIKDRQFVKCLVFHDSMPFKHKKRAPKSSFFCYWMNDLSSFFYFIYCFPSIPEFFF